VREYMKEQNRPYNLQTIIDNLTAKHGALGKTAAQKIIDRLVSSNYLTEKEFGKTKIYWFNQVFSIRCRVSALMTLCALCDYSVSSSNHRKTLHQWIRWNWPVLTTR
jgi:hypothetical protein